MAARLQHGSHAHPLQQMGISETNGTATSCRACGLPFASELVLFGCRNCGFFLHRFCALQPPSLPGDPAYHQHQLRLLYAPAYPSGSFRCDICRKVGSALNYHCRSCNFDAHPLCANLPRTAHYPGHEHPLRFLFKPTAAGSTRCDVCGSQVHHCCYECSSCNFVLHPWCLRKRLPKKKTSKAKEFGKRVLVAAAAHVVLALLGLGGGSFLEDSGDTDVPDQDDDLDDTDGGDEDVDDMDGDYFGVDMDTFDDLPGLDGVDDPLQAEAVSLLLTHMEGMAFDEASSTS